MLSLNEIRRRAQLFAHEWQHEVNEEGEAKSFWDGFFEVFGLPRRRVASFEKAVRKLDERQGFIDLLWKGTLLIEHKSRGKDLDKAYQQALAYFPGLKDIDLPRYVLVSDFARFRLCDLEAGTEVEFRLENLPDNIHLFDFISGHAHKRTSGDTGPVNQKAAALMADLHDAIANDGFAGHELEVFLMRVLFCLFAEDTGIFEKDQFRDFLERRTAEDGSDTGPRLRQLFSCLDTPRDKRQQSLDETIKAFEYINGGLFSERTETPEFNAQQRETLIRCTYFDWSQISPAIFGSLFQSVTDPKRRRTLGAHYTSEENILKVVNGLFMDELRAELDKARGNFNRLDVLHWKVAKIKFLDPSCGCGNFLVITYRELRRFEIEIWEEKIKLGKTVETSSRIDVSCAFGIEIEEFPARVAETAMWLMDHLMNRELSKRFGNLYLRIPLQASATIAHANALRLDWNEVLPAEQCSYVLGNPPFVGSKLMTEEQRADMVKAVDNIKNSGNLDFVSGWYALAMKYIRESDIKVAFVSTNSITQGEQPGTLFKHLQSAYKLEIVFAHRTFKWNNEASNNAAVYCVIVGFRQKSNTPIKKCLFDYPSIAGDPVVSAVSNINPYLVDFADLLIDKRSNPICNVPSMAFGNMPLDGNHFILSPEERAEIISQEPELEPFILPFIGAQDFINGGLRYCIWLVDARPQQISSSRILRSRIRLVREWRMNPDRHITTQQLANNSQLFRDTNRPHNYILFPSTSSERRDYIPIGFLDFNSIANNSTHIIPNATLFHFGILTSAAHMAWVRTVCGRLKSDYRYSKDIVYNNFPWPQGVTDKQREAVEAAAQAVLDARAAHPGATLAQLYDPLTMPPNLVQAHRKLDALVDKLYGLPAQATEAQRIARLFELYQQLTAPLLPVAKAPKARRKKT